VLISYVPDGSPVRKRMLFASSLERCRKELGATYFVSELHGSEPSELTWAAYTEHAAAAKVVRSDDVMSATERALVREAVQEVDSGGGNAHAVRFPASAAAREALGSPDALVVLRLDLAAESIELAERVAAVPVGELAAHLDRQEPRFAVYRWAHEHEGAEVTSTVFVYSCPDSAPVKAKMSYSAVKSIVVDLAGKVDARIQVTDLDEENSDLSEENLRKTLHPAAVEARSSNRVTKPKGPSKGPRKLVK
jgi:twinfilin-like protein